jgi:myo-inositol-1(or 4)-monophosphatase
MKSNETADILERIRRAMTLADGILRDFTPGRIAADRKAGGDPVTEADIAVNDALRKELLREGEGWLSEETKDDPGRLAAGRVWIVDPIDGTKEFIAGIPEWCVSIGYIEDGEAVAGGIYNRQAGHTIVGAAGVGVTLNGQPAVVKDAGSLDGALVLASRSEVNRGEWAKFEGSAFQVRPMGSVAYKLGCVAAGLADATWTLVPKNEWDIAAGVALVHAAGGVARTLEGARPRFNRTQATKLRGLIAGGRKTMEAIDAFLSAGNHTPKG